MEKIFKIRPINKNQAVNLQKIFTRMPKRIFLTLVVFGFLADGKIFAQQKNVEKNSFLPKYSFVFPVKNDISRYALPGSFSFVNTGITKRSVNIFPSLAAADLTCKRDIIAGDYYTSHLGFFCRKELQVERATYLPLRFRLGSLEYTNYLEQKPDSYFRR